MSAVWHEMGEKGSRSLCTQQLRADVRFVLSVKLLMDAAVRVAWSKGWGYSEAGPWTSSAVMRREVPESLTLGRPANEGWDDALESLDSLDPHGLFRNVFLDKLMLR